MREGSSSKFPADLEIGPFRLGRGNGKPVHLPFFLFVIPMDSLIPWCCGTDKYGETGHVFGAKRILRCVTEGGDDKHNVLPAVSKILQVV